MKSRLIFFLLFISYTLFGQQISIVPLSKLSSTLGGINYIDFSEGSELLVAADKKGGLQLWDLESLSPVAKASPGGKTVNVVFLQDNKIAFIDESGKLKVYDQNLSLLSEHNLKAKVKQAIVDPDRSSLSYLTKDNELKIFNFRANMQQSEIDVSSRMKESLYLGYDRFGQQLALLASDGTSIILDPVNQQVKREVMLRSDEFSGSASVVHAAASNKGSDLFVTGIQEVFIPKGGLQGNQPERRNSILTYDWDTSEELKRIRVNHAVDNIELGPGPSHMTYFTKKRFDVTIVDLSQGAEVSQVTMDEFPATIKISDDDAYLAAGDGKGTIHLYTLERNAAPQIRITNPPMHRGYGETMVEHATVELEGALSDNAKVKNVMINNVPAEIVEGGKFKVDLDLIPGKNKIRIVAEDYQSNTVFKDVYITRNPDIEKIKQASGDFSAQKRKALVIGNASYEGAAQLFNTVNDANAIASTLEELDFDVTVITDGGYEDMKNGILKFGSEISDVDVTIFYYAGHGLEIDGINYLVPVDAQINSTLDVKQKTIPLTGVLNTVKYTNDDGLNMIILDACRNNPFPTGRRGGAGLAKSTPPSGTLIAYSTSPGSVASDGEGENGLYTGELIRQMKIPQRIEDVFINTRNNVEEISKGAQQPWEEQRLRGIFYLNY